MQRCDWAPCTQDCLDSNNKQVLNLEAEEGNQHDRCAGAVMKNNQIVGHMPCCVYQVLRQVLFRE